MKTNIRKITENNYILKGILVGLLVMISGFFMMLYFYNTMDFPMDVPGFFYYQAATWGDCLCLPLITGFLSAFISKNRKVKETTNATTTKIFTIIGLILGIAIQGYWLWNDTVVLNWTIPYPNCFNLAGWWHSLFFIAIFGLLFYQLSLFFQIVRKKSQVDGADAILWCGAFSMGCCYLLIHFHDDYSQTYASALIYSIVIACYGLILSALIHYFAKPNNRIILHKGMPISIFVALSIAILICENVNGDVLFALGIALLFHNIWETNSLFKCIALLFSITISTYVVIYYITSLDNETERVAILFLVSILYCLSSFWFRTKSKTDTKIDMKVEVAQISSPIIIIFLYLGFIYKPSFVSNLNSFAQDKLYMSIFTITLTVGEFLCYRSEIKNIITSENKEKNVKQEKRAESIITHVDYVKNISYLKMGSMVVGIMVLLACWVIKFDTKKVIETYQTFWFPSYLFIVYILCVTVILIMLIVTKLGKDIHKKMVCTCVIICVFLLILFTGMFILRDIVYVSDSIIVDCITLLPTLFSSIGSSFLLSDGFINNAAIIRGLDLKKYSYLLFLKKAFLLGGLLIYCFNAVILVFGHNLSAIIISFINTFFISVLIPASCLFSLKIKATPESKLVVRSHPIRSVIQDGLAIILAQVFLTALPIAIVYFSSALYMLPLCMTSMMAAIHYCIKLNKQCIDRSKGYIVPEIPETRTIWESYKTWINTQIRWTKLASTPYIHIFFLISFIKYSITDQDDCEKRKSFESFKNDFW